MHEFSIKSSSAPDGGDKATKPLTIDRLLEIGSSRLEKLRDEKVGAIKEIREAFGLLYSWERKDIYRRRVDFKNIELISPFEMDQKEQWEAALGSVELNLLGLKNQAEENLNVVIIDDPLNERMRVETEQGECVFKVKIELNGEDNEVKITDYASNSLVIRNGKIYGNEMMIVVRDPRLSFYSLLSPWKERYDKAFDENGLLMDSGVIEENYNTVIEPIRRLEEERKKREELIEPIKTDDKESEVLDETKRVLIEEIESNSYVLEMAIQGSSSLFAFEELKKSFQNSKLGFQKDSKEKRQIKTGLLKEILPVDIIFEELGEMILKSSDEDSVITVGEMTIRIPIDNLMMDNEGNLVGLEKQSDKDNKRLVFTIRHDIRDPEYKHQILKEPLITYKKLEIGVVVEEMKNGKWEKTPIVVKFDGVNTAGVVARILEDLLC